MRFTEAKGTRMEKELLLLFIYYTETKAARGEAQQKGKAVYCWGD